MLVAEQPMLLRLEGEVWVARRGRGQPIAITDTATVAADDRFLTGDDGRAVLVWPQGAVLAIEPRSRVQLVGSGSTRQQVWLDAGEVWLAGGEGADERAVGISGDEGLRAEGVRLRARRVAGDGLQVLTYDAPAWLTGGGRTQLVPRGAESQASSNRGPTLPRPLSAGRALGVRVAGAGGWAVVDGAGRATGQLPGAGSWVGAIPGSSQPYRDGAATTVVLPAEADGLRLILWGAGAPRQVEITAWATDLAATVAGRTAPPATASRIHEQLDADAVVVLALASGEGATALSRPLTRGTTLPADLRLLAPAGPRSIAPEASPTVRATPSPVPPESPEEEPSSESQRPPAAPAGSAMSTPGPEAPQPTAAAPTAAPGGEPSTEPLPTETAAPARFERHAVEFALPAPSPTPTAVPRTVVVAPPPSPVPISSPTRPVPTVALHSTPVAAITAVLPTRPPTPLPTLLPPTVPPARPTAVTAPANRGPSPVVPGAPPSGAPPGGLGLNAWGGATGGGGASSGGAAANAPAPPGPSGPSASTGGASAPASSGGRAGTSGAHP